VGGEGGDAGRKKTGRSTTCSYMEALVECLYYQPNLEMQLVAANIVADLCASRQCEVEADLQPLHFDGGQSSQHYHSLTQLLRFRLGMVGAIPPFVLLTFQGQDDLQLLGTRGLAGLAMHPANRAGIATTDGLRSLVIHTLSHYSTLRATSVIALNRLSIQPRQLVNYDEYDVPMDPLSMIGARTTTESVEDDDVDGGDGKKSYHHKKKKKKKKKKNSVVSRCSRGHKVLDDDDYCLACNTMLDASFRRSIQCQASWFEKQAPATQEGIIILSKLYRDAPSVDHILQMMVKDDLIPPIPNCNVRHRGSLGHSKNGGDGTRRIVGRHKTLLELDSLRSLCTLLLRSIHDMEEDTNDAESINSKTATSIRLSPQKQQQEKELLERTALDRWVTLLSLHALQSLLVQSEDAAVRLCRICVDLPHYTSDHVTRKDDDNEVPGLTGLHLVLLMCLPPKSLRSRILASRVLVQIAKEDDNIALFQSHVYVPAMQQKILHKKRASSLPSSSFLSTATPNTVKELILPSCIDLVSMVSHDKDAEIAANAVISMLSLSIDERTTAQILKLQALPKICSLVGAASANIAVQRRAMFLLCMIGDQCSTMTDIEFSKIYIPQVVLPLLIEMSGDDRDWIVRREAIRALAVYALRRQCAHHIILLNGVEVLLNTIHETTSASIFHASSEASGKNIGESSGNVPPIEIAHVTEQLSLKALGMLIIYDELVIEIQKRVKKDSRFFSLINIFGDRSGQEWNIPQMLLQKRKIVLNGNSIASSTVSNDALEVVELEEDIRGMFLDLHDTKDSDADAARQGITTNITATTRFLTKELRIQACLGIVMLLRPEHIVQHLPHWLDLIVHWLRETTMNTFQVKCIAAIAHIAQCSHSHLRFIEPCESYTEPRDKWLDGVHSDELDDDHNNLHGLNILPDLVNLLRRENTPIAVSREIAKVFTHLSSKPTGMELWLKFQAVHATKHHFYIDHACINLACVKGRPIPWREDLKSSDDKNIDTLKEEGGIDEWIKGGSISTKSNEKNESSNGESNEDENSDHENDDMKKSDYTNSPVIGIQFNQLDAVFVVPRSHVQGKLRHKHNAKNDSFSESRSSSYEGNTKIPGVKLVESKDEHNRYDIGIPDEETIINDSWTISCWFYIQKKIGDNMSKSQTSLMSLTGDNATKKNHYATLCEGTNGDQHVCVRVVPLTEEEEEKEIASLIAQKKKNKNNNNDDDDDINGEDFFQNGAATRVRHELGGWDSNLQEWHSSGFNMTRVPKGWHHLVVISSLSKTYYYIDTMQVGVIDDWTSTAPILSIGNAVDLLHPFGVISDFRIFRSKIPRNMLINRSCPFNVSPRTKMFSGGLGGILGSQEVGYIGSNGDEEEGEEGEGLSQFPTNFTRKLNGIRPKVAKRTSLRTSARNAMLVHNALTEAHEKTLTKTKGYERKKMGIGSHNLSMVQDVSTLQPWTLLDECLVHLKLGGENQGVSLVFIIVVIIILRECFLTFLQLIYVVFKKKILTALTGALQKGADEVTIWACNALGNLATAGSNRICIIRNGGVIMLLGPCNSNDPLLALEAARALVLLR
jgi:hypothetical protein